jgi:hypothetical protein
VRFLEASLQPEGPRDLGLQLQDIAAIRGGFRQGNELFEPDLGFGGMLKVPHLTDLG